MSDAFGPHRTVQKQRREKPYDRPVYQKQHLRRSASFVDSVKAIVTKPFAWLRFPSNQAKATVDPAGRDHRSPSDFTSVTTSPQKRPASPTHDNDLARSSKKQRRATPLTNGSVHSDRPLRSSVSAPLLSSSHVSTSHTRANLPPLPRLTQSLQPFTDSSRWNAPSSRASPAASARRLLPARRSIIPEPIEGDAFGMSYRSPFIRPSLTPVVPESRQSSIFADLPRPRPSLATDDQRMRTVSPYRSTPLGSPTRRTVDIPQSLVLPPRSASMTRSETLMNFGPPNAPLPMAFRNSPLTPTTSWQPALGPLSSVESMAQTQSATSPPPSISSTSAGHVSTDSIFKALEGALPWSEARKLRHDQRASVKVPASSTTSARAGRITKPYARPNSLGSESHGAGVERQGLLTSLSEKRKAAEKARLEKFDHPERMSKSGKLEPKSFFKTISNEQVNGTNESDHQDIAKPKEGKASRDTGDAVDMAIEKAPTEAEKKVDNGGLAPPVSLPPPSISFDAVQTAKGSLSRQGSSLRVGRTKTSAFTHGASVPLRRPNRFGVIDDDDSDGDAKEDDGLPDVQELNEWAMKSGISMTIPVGWSLGSETSAWKTLTSEGKDEDAKGDVEDSKMDAFTPSQDKPKAKPTPLPYSMPSFAKGSSGAPGPTAAGASPPHLSAFPPPGLVSKPFTWFSSAPSIDIKATSPTPSDLPSASSSEPVKLVSASSPVSTSLGPFVSLSSLAPPSYLSSSTSITSLQLNHEPSILPTSFEYSGEFHVKLVQSRRVSTSESTPSFVVHTSSLPPSNPTPNVAKDNGKLPVFSGFGGSGTLKSHLDDNSAESTPASPKPSNVFAFSAAPSPTPDTDTASKANVPTKTSAFSFPTSTTLSSSPSPFTFASFSQPVAFTPTESTTSPTTDSPSADSTTSTPTTSPFASFTSPATAPKSAIPSGQPSARPNGTDANAPTVSPVPSPFSFGTSHATLASPAATSVPSNPFAFGSKPSINVEPASRRTGTFNFQPVIANGGDATSGVSKPPVFDTAVASRGASTSAADFSFGSPSAGGEKATTFTGTPPSTPPIKPSVFSFDMSKPAKPTTPAVVFGNGAMVSRPKTPPMEQTIDTDAGMELSPERPSTEAESASFTPTLVTSSNPFSFGSQSSAFGNPGTSAPKPAFTFGSPQTTATTSNPFTASATRAPAFAPPSAFGGATTSAFGGAPSLPSISPFGSAAPSNGGASFPSNNPVFGNVGSGNSSPVTASATPPSQPAFGFTFSASPAGSPTLSPIQTSAPAPPFVFGASAGSDSESQTKPPTPTTPRRAVKGLPNRRAKR
ncbi:hypothetical protein BS47DRAFT_1482371 [Hydnum rufescens UP504]|uniref:Uncharacterized protein n=1 Tax=Hydnum rufescens UP504 TaxID=1448309 RepID=A0A9P6B6Y1_9AGAM|nr:hypothetical protein BS47DRAFT_1482371 [Hydnum rufescens UP504]